MSESIEEILKKIKANTSIESSPDSDFQIPPDTEYGLAGDPDCPHCKGLGYVRLEVPLGHPDFGKAQVCVCRRGEVGQFVRQRLYALSQLNELKHLNFEEVRRQLRRTREFIPEGNAMYIPVPILHGYVQMVDQSIKRAGSKFKFLTTF